MNQDPSRSPVDHEKTQKTEEEIERLAQETSQLIRTADREEREELRKYAKNTLQQETEASRLEQVRSADGKQKVPFNPLALAIPLAQYPKPVRHPHHVLLGNITLIVPVLSRYVGAALFLRRLSSAYNQEAIVLLLRRLATLALGIPKHTGSMGFARKKRITYTLSESY
jgi:hypothetical protein